MFVFYHHILAVMSSGPPHACVNPDNLQGIFKYCLKLLETYPNRQTPEEGRRVQGSKCCDNNNKNEDISPSVNNNQ